MSNTTLPIYSLDLTQLSNITYEQIENWIAAYPYSHNLHALKILSAKARKDVDFETILSSEIMYIPDRSHLKKLIENLDQISKKETEVSHEIIDKAQISTEENSYPDGLTTSVTPTDNELEAISHSETEYEAIVEDSSDNISTIENEPTEAYELLSIPIEEASSQIIQEEVTEQVTKELEPPIIKSSMEEKETANITEKISLLYESDEDQELSDFSRWLKSRSSVKTYEDPVNIIEVINTGSINEWEGIQEKILANYHSGALNKEEKQKKETGDKKKKKLKPKIDETEVITESYALLLEQQGKYNKAIKIYEKLSLIIPEKTTYFADKIEYLKNK